MPGYGHLNVTLLDTDKTVSMASRFTITWVYFVTSYVPLLVITKVPSVELDSTETLTITNQISVYF